jgi:DNA-directed RNA polymerase subunit M/transcription elongation factor TFIIS
MEFCVVCDNMLYLSKREDEMELVYICKKCGSEREKNDSDESIIVSTLSFSKQAQYTSVINKYTKLDPKYN